MNNPPPIAERIVTCQLIKQLEGQKWKYQIMLLSHREHYHTFNNTDLSKIKQLPFLNYLSDDYAFLRKGRYNKSGHLCSSVITFGFFRARSKSSSSKTVIFTALS